MPLRHGFKFLNLKILRPLINRSRYQIPVKVRVRQLFCFAKCLPGNLENTTVNNKEYLSTSFEKKFSDQFYCYLLLSIILCKLKNIYISFT